MPGNPGESPDQALSALPANLELVASGTGANAVRFWARRVLPPALRLLSPDPGLLPRPLCPSLCFKGCDIANGSSPDAFPRFSGVKANLDFYAGIERYRSGSCCL